MPMQPETTVATHHNAAMEHAGAAVGTTPAPTASVDPRPTHGCRCGHAERTHRKNGRGRCYGLGCECKRFRRVP